MTMATRSTRKLLTTFDLPLLVFLISAAAGVWIAYDRPAAWEKFWLILIGMVLYSGLARIPEAVRVGKWEMPLLKWILGSLPAFVAIYFFLTNDWASRVGKIPWLDPVMRWFAAWQPNVLALRVNSNVIGGVIAALLPLQIAALFQNHTRQRILLGVVLVGLAGLGLMMSASRGAWLAVAFVLIAWATHPRGSFRPVGSKPIWASIVVVTLLTVIAFLTLTPVGESLLALRSDRLTVWRNSLDLVSDYALSGLGLGNFEMAYSSYVLLVHVGHTVHAHNLFLDIWLENGLLGLLAWGGLIMTAFWPVQSPSRWRPAAIASLCVLLLHGMVDDAFYGYGGYAACLLLIPFAMLAHSDQDVKAEDNRPARSLAVFLDRQLHLMLWCAAIVALVLGSFTPDAQAIYKANVGAVMQTQVELTGYRWPESKFQDVVRLLAKDRLAPAIEWYQSALKSNPANATANRRLGQIELSFRQLDAACHHLQAAYGTAPDPRATRQLLGECYALAGQTDQAVSLWRTLDLSYRQLELREWWYAEYLHDLENATRLTQAILALDK